MIDAGELAALEATLLPALERHHLRLLAHGLRTLQAAAGRRHGSLPDASALRAWAAQNEQLAADPAFSATFLCQLQALAGQLEAIAAPDGRGALDLDLQDLIRWSEGQARVRLDPHAEASESRSAPLSPAEPPAS